MAEVKMGSVQSGLTREKTSLDTPVVAESPHMEKLELKGTVVVRKPSFLSRLKDTFIAEDARDVGDYIVWDILIPTIKRTIRDIIVGAADRVFLGVGTSSVPSSVYRVGSSTSSRRTDYTASNRLASKRPGGTGPRIEQRTNTINFGLDNIIFDKYDDAASVLESLVDCLDRYGQVKVDDYFDLIGQSAPLTFPAQKWGWTSLSTACIVTTINGYFIKLPKPSVL